LSCDKEKGSLKFERDLSMIGNFFLVVVCAMFLLIIKRLINRQQRLMLRED
jgi:hypothetical protein